MRYDPRTDQAKTKEELVFYPRTVCRPGTQDCCEGCRGRQALADHRKWINQQYLDSTVSLPTEAGFSD